MSYVQLGANNTSNNANVTAGAPSGGYNDGINWPWDTNGDTPNFDINWNSNPPPTLQQIEEAYKDLIRYLKDHPGGDGFYNGAILLLKMTVDIGQHLGNYTNKDGTNPLADFMNNQITVGGSALFLQQVIQIAAEAAAVSQSTEQAGADAAQKFLASLASATQGLTNWGTTYKDIFGEAYNDQFTIGTWCSDHFKTYTDPVTGATDSGWFDDESNGTDNPYIFGQQKMTFAQFVEDASSSLGDDLDPSSNSSVNGTINDYYQSQIAMLVAEFKGNPWALLLALMSLINERDLDDGSSVNSFGSTTDLLKKANALIQKMLGDISGTTPNAADYFKQLAALKDLVLKNPSLAGITSQFLSDAATVEGMQVAVKAGVSWTVKAGYYNFPPGTVVNVTTGGVTKQITIGPNGGQIYVGEQSTFSLKSDTTLSFGQLAAMGNTDAIQATMGDWTTQAMSNFINATTAIQTLLNSMSPAIQQEIQNTTQTMSARENFEKEAFASITNLNQQIMALIKSILG